MSRFPVWPLLVLLLGTPSLSQEKPAVVRDQLKGSINHGGGRSVLQRIVGKARVIDATTIEYADGTRIDLNITVPELTQMGMIEGRLYPCGREAADHLRQLIGDSPVACYRYADDRGPWWGYVGDTYLRPAMILAGWALADHSSNQAAEAIARENKRGLWRGTFLHPEEWRGGARLPGEAPPPKLTDERQANKLLADHGLPHKYFGGFVARGRFVTQRCARGGWGCDEMKGDGAQRSKWLCLTS